MMTSLQLWCLYDMHRYIMCLETGIGLFLAWVFVYLLIPKTEQTPTLISSRWIESLWTLIPSVLLISLVIPLVVILYCLLPIGASHDVIHVLGNQWFWTFWDDASVYLAGQDLMDASPGALRQLTGTQTICLAQGTNVEVLGSANDVIHAIAVPGLGVKMDVVPGRLSAMAMGGLIEGLYYGQCSELCGALHGFMPLTIKVEAA